jgi:chemotaxis family two-component system response regulator PixG
VSASGMKFTSIQNLTTIIPALIDQKPDLIFLDLIMPVASSYEICTQIRRISLFAKTPVIILTESDGIFDNILID